MKKRIISLVMITVICISTLVGCGKKGDNAVDNRPDTVANNLYKEFVQIIKDDQNLLSVADKLTQSKEFKDIAMVTMEVEPGYLNGFNEEVTGFKTGVIFAPMIGTIPFVGYVFDTDDADALMEELKAKGQLDWNICTMADEMVVEKIDNYVFLCMAPEKFE